MIHCPYCGTPVKKDESYCMKCGKHLPDNIETRLKKKPMDKFWILPMVIALAMLITVGSFYIILQHKTHMAKQMYEQGIEYIDNKQYNKALQAFNDAREYNHNLSQAEMAYTFAETAIQIEQDIKQSQQEAKSNNFHKALTLVNETEQQLDKFSGEAVSELIKTISDKRDTVKTAQLEHKLQNDPGIDELKMLLFDAEEIDNQKANQMTEDIREHIINYTFTKASEQINDRHFKDADIIVEDGLKYAPESEKLLSLETTIQNEQAAFEANQAKRIEQAINTATQEQNINENDAIKTSDVSATEDDQGNLVVKGTVKSVATIPINAISVEYALSTEDEEAFTTNQVYVYPDTLYPGETGEFEYTHFDMQTIDEAISINVETIKWYTT